MPRDFLQEAIKLAREDNAKKERQLRQKNNRNSSGKVSNHIRQNNRRYDVFAIAVDKKHREIVQRRNSYIKTHPMQERFANLAGEEDKRFLHAEIHAISRATKPYAIYIARVGRDGTTKLAKPCRICELAIKEAGIKEVYYTI